MFLFGLPTTLNVLYSHWVISIPAFVRASSKVSRGLFPILHPHDHTNLTSQNLFSPTGIKRIEALNFVASSDVRSKYSFDSDSACSASFSIFFTSEIFGLLFNWILLFIR